MTKPKDLIIPFTWKERKVCISDRVLFYPPRTELNDFVFPGWDHPDLFGNSNPVHIEYCSGTGAWILERAKQNPHINWFAIEKRSDRAKKIWAKIKNYQLPNLILGFGEGLAITTHCIPSASIQEVFINFPDPWPKRRHAKNRIVSPAFVSEVFRVLKPQGSITLVTDDADYSTIMIDEMRSHQGFCSEIAEPYFMEAPQDYGTSFFESLFRSQGKTIHLHKFQKHETHTT